MVATTKSRVAASSRGEAIAPRVESRTGDASSDAIAPLAERATSRAGDAIAVALIAIAFGLALGGPATLVLVAPIVLGVPHVASDVRYLVVRGPLRGSALVAIIVPLALITGQRATALAGGAFSPHVELALGFAAIIAATIAGAASSSAAAFAVATRGSWSSSIPGARTIAIIALVLTVAIPAVSRPQLAMVVLLHAHNLVAIALWLAWPARANGAHTSATNGATDASGVTDANGVSDASTLRAKRPIVLLLAAGLVAIFSGACDGIAGELGGLANTFAPGVEPLLANRIALAFAFLQAVHYIAWLYIIPRALDAQPLRGLTRDFGRAGVIAIVIATIAVPLAALATDAARVREVYLSVVVFHAWLEVAVAAYLVARRT